MPCNAGKNANQTFHSQQPTAHRPIASSDSKNSSSSQPRFLYSGYLNYIALTFNLTASSAGAVLLFHSV